jgi:hypothetical protein
MSFDVDSAESPPPGHRRSLKPESPELVVHLTTLDGWGGRRRLGFNPAWALVGILPALLGVWRWSQTGRGAYGLVVGLLLVLMMLAAIFGYSRLKLSNATVFVKQGRLGVSTAFGFRKAVPIASLDYIQLCTVDIRDAPRPVRLLMVISKAGACALQLSGADGLRAGGIHDLAAASGLVVRGSWAQTISLGDLRRTFPGAGSRMLRFFAFGQEHLSELYWWVFAATFLIFLIGGAIYVVVTTR